MAARKVRAKAKPTRPTTVAAYLASLTPDKRAVIEKARALVHNHIPKGYAEFMNETPNGKYTTPFSEKLLVDAFKKAGKRLDMGKCCLHFKALDDLELASVAKVIAMSTPKEYVAYYKRVKGLA